MMERETKAKVARLAAAAILFVIVLLLPVKGITRLAFFLIPYLIAGYDVLWEAAEGLFHGEVFDEDFLMSVATICAFCIGEYPEAVFVMLFFLVGELFEELAEARSRVSVTKLMDLRPDFAWIETDEGREKCDPAEIHPGQVIVVAPGERVPLDGELVSGNGNLNTSALTGESVPRYVESGDTILSGCTSLDSTLYIRVTKGYGESTVSRILELVEENEERKSHSESFIRRFAEWYTPIVVVLAVFLAIVPSLITGNWATWIHRALVFLVTSCPCALILSIPLTFFGGIGGASRHGILIKGSNYLEALAEVQTVVFDKTGTLTRGNFSVTKLEPAGCSAEELLELAATAEQYSSHPVAHALREAFGRTIEEKPEVTELAGRGVKAIIGGQEVCVGNRRLMEETGIRIPEQDFAGTAVFVSTDGVFRGTIQVSDTLRETAEETVEELKQRSLKTVMLTGDRREAAQEITEILGIDAFKAELLPQDKVTALEQLMTSEEQRLGKVLFVGDGMNDAPVLARADVGVAMGAIGSDSAIEAADVVLMDDDPKRLLTALDIAKKVRRIARENIIFAIAVKAVILALAIPGISTLWAASFADVGVCVLAVANAGRALFAVRSRP